MWETWVQSLGWEDPLEQGKGYPLQYSILENSMNCIVHGNGLYKESDMTEQLSGEELETLNMDAAPLVPFSLSRLVSDSCAVDLR